MLNMENTFKNPSFLIEIETRTGKEQKKIWTLKNRYKSILFDINLPDLKCLEFTKTIQETPEGELVLIIELSSNSKILV